jgi:multiple sugar transport system substrate-binding protein
VRALAAAAALSMLALGACESGTEDAGGGSEEVEYTDNPTGALAVWGFNNADDVGKARLNYAKSQLSGVTITLDETGFDSQKFTTRAASKTLPDVVQMDR